MTYRIRCGEDLSVSDCPFVAEGDAPGPIVKQVVDHLHDKHDLDMPAAEAILTRTERISQLDRPVQLIVDRLRTKLDLPSTTEPGAPNGPVVPPPMNNQ